MGNDLSIWTLVLDASVIVQAVMLLLMFASVASWAVIFKKSRVISQSRRQADQFEAAFWSGGDLAALYRGIETRGRAGTGEQSIFESFHLGTHGFSFLFGLPALYFLYLVFRLPGESSRRYGFKSEFLGFRTLCRQHYHGAVLGLAFRPRSAKIWKTQRPPRNRSTKG